MFKSWLNKFFKKENTTALEEIKLLIVNYEKGMIFFMEKISQKLGLKTFSATDSQNALRLFSKERPRIVVADVELPYSEFNGNELIRRIKEIDKDTICLVATCRTYDDDKDLIAEAKRAGALHYFRPDIEIFKQTILEAKELASKKK